MSEMNIFILVTFILSFLIIGINFIVLVLMLKHTKLLKSTSNKILFSLICSDLMSGLSMLLHVVTALNDDLLRPMTSRALVYRIVVDLITLWLQLLSMGNLCFIIFERYMALCHTYSLQKYINEKKTKIVLTFIWVASFSIPCIQLSWLHKRFNAVLTLKDYELISKADSIFSSISITLFVLIPLILLFIALYRMLRVIRAFPCEVNRQKRKDDTRALKIFSIMYLTFVTFCLPYFTIRLLIDLKLLQKAPSAVMITFFVMKYIPPFLNPFIYVLKKPEFRNLLKYPGQNRNMLNDRRYRYLTWISNESRRGSQDTAVVLMDNNSSDSNPCKSYVTTPVDINCLLSADRNNNANSNED